MDLVAHCGWTGAGAFLYTLSLVGAGTGWLAGAGRRDKHQALSAQAAPLEASRVD